MKLYAVIILSVFTFVQCVKRPSKDPVPTLEYKEALNMKRTPQGVDTVVIKVGYEDGNGDLFVDEFSQKSNLFVMTYYFDNDSGKFVRDLPRPVTYKIKLPDVNYKDKPVRGDIYVPMREFRSSELRDVIRFTVYVEDKQGNVSNVVTSPTYSLDF